MNKIGYALLIVWGLLPLNTVCSTNTIPFVGVSASNSDGIMLSENLVNNSGLSENTVLPCGVAEQEF